MPIWLFVTVLRVQGLAYVASATQVFPVHLQLPKDAPYFDPSDPAAYPVRSVYIWATLLRCVDSAHRYESFLLSSVVADCRTMRIGSRRSSKSTWTTTCTRSSIQTNTTWCTWWQWPDPKGVDRLLSSTEHMCAFWTSSPHPFILVCRRLQHSHEAQPLPATRKSVV